MAKKTDSNQREIVDALRKSGCSVQTLHELGKGVPDLLVARGGVMWLMEVKGKRGMVNDYQRVWAMNWNAPVYVVRSVDEALRVIFNTTQGAESAIIS